MKLNRTLAALSLAVTTLFAQPAQAADGDPLPVCQTIDSLDCTGTFQTQSYGSWKLRSVNGGPYERFVSQVDQDRRLDGCQSYNTVLYIKNGNLEQSVDKLLEEVYRVEAKVNQRDVKLLKKQATIEKLRRQLARR